MIREKRIAIYWDAEVVQVHGSAGSRRSDVIVNCSRDLTAKVIKRIIADKS
jgi:hypothetical protein